MKRATILVSISCILALTPVQQSLARDIGRYQGIGSGATPAPDRRRDDAAAVVIGGLLLGGMALAAASHDHHHRHHYGPPPPPGPQPAPPIGSGAVPAPPLPGPHIGDGAVPASQPPIGSGAVPQQPFYDPYAQTPPQGAPFSPGGDITCYPRQLACYNHNGSFMPSWTRKVFG